jgi:hypothetical protein
VLQEPAIKKYITTDVDKDRMNWALNIIQTRNCKVTQFNSLFLKSCAENVNILAPYFDLLNHSDDAETCFYTSNGYLCVDVNYSIRSGEEVFLNYGEHCPYSLLAKYGFWPDKSKKNIIPILLPRKLARSVLLPQNSARLRLLQKAGIMVTGTFFLSRDLDVSDDLLTALIILSANDSQIVEIENAALKSETNSLDTSESWNLKLDASSYVLLGIIRTLSFEKNLELSAILLLIDILENNHMVYDQSLVSSVNADSTSVKTVQGFYDYLQNFIEERISNLKLRVSER